MMDGINSRDFMDLDCNCTNDNKRNGVCVFGGYYRKKCVVYKATCNCKEQHTYIGCTQNGVKKRFDGHWADVINKVKRDKNSSSFAKHMAEHFKESKKQEDFKIEAKDVRDQLISVEVIWQGNPISCTKSFGKTSCTLCKRERCLILEGLNNNKQKMMNSRNELFGACRHKTRFHRLIRNNCPNTG